MFVEAAQALFFGLLLELSGFEWVNSCIHHFLTEKAIYVLDAKIQVHSKLLRLDSHRFLVRRIFFIVFRTVPDVPWYTARMSRACDWRGSSLASQ